MAEILGLGMSHYPLMARPLGMKSIAYRLVDRPDIPDGAKDPANWPAPMQAELGDDEGIAYARAHREAFGAECRRVRKALDAFNPDAVLIWGDDQYENFKEDIVPAFCVLAYDDMEVYPYRPVVDPLGSASSSLEHSAENAWSEPPNTKLDLPGNRALAKEIACGLIAEKIDIAYAYQPLHYPSLSHAFLNTVLFLDWDRDRGWPYPIIPFQINCYGERVIVNRGFVSPVGKIELPKTELDPPGPTPERCMEVGAAVARVLSKRPERIALIASSSWSHAFLTPKHHFAYPDVESDTEMYDALVRGDFGHWRGVTNDQVYDRGQQEMRNWWALMGAMEEAGCREPSYHAFIESYSQNSNKCFVVYEPR